MQMERERAVDYCLKVGYYLGISLLFAARHGKNLHMEHLLLLEHCVRLGKMVRSEPTKISANRLGIYIFMATHWPAVHAWVIKYSSAEHSK
jgi:hypothetical protein